MNVTAREPEHTRTGFSVDVLHRAFLDNLFFVLGRFPEVASMHDNYQALAHTVRDRLLRRWVRSAQTYKHDRARTVCFLSAEYLPGPHLGNNLLTLGIMDDAREAMRLAGLDLDELIESEVSPGLGNGGLGRLAACYMDSLATLQIPAIGYGIRYEYGMFDQEIRDGWQVESTDRWLRDGNPWELRRPCIAYEVKFGGRTESETDAQGRQRGRWIPAEMVRGIAHDTPIPGYGVGNANLLRLWAAEATESFDFEAFNRGDYFGAVQRKVRSETISKVLYPNDEPEIGKRLRLMQQHFFVSCSLQDMLRLFRQSGLGLDRFHEKFAVQLNDTHPAIAVVELMRLLIDEHMLPWDTAWDVVTRTFGYTNHTLLPEALEKWPLSLFQSILPRHMEIVFEINHRFLEGLRTAGADPERIAALSLIDETPPRYVRMAHVACVGSHSINGVAALHTELLESTVLREFHAVMPHKFSNKTNGVTPRRMMRLANPGLAALLDEVAGPGWVRDLSRLRALEPLAEDAAFQERWRAVKHERKLALARHVARQSGVTLDPASMYDVQAKRIHEYKRQHLNVLHIVALYDAIKRNPDADVVPRAFIFGGKAAPGYYMAKLIIKLINAVGEVVNDDPDVRGRLKVAFVPDMNVKTGQRIYPAADLSEQISLAGKEASGTGNMKFSMNGALTIGTLDGANVEIRDEVGPGNFFLFGLTTDEVARKRAEGYRPWEFYQGNASLKRAIDLIAGGRFSRGDPDLFKPLVDHLLNHDEYMLLADFQSYVDCQREVDRAWRDPKRWTAMSILNVARIGKFSSDRAIAEYCRDIWKIDAVAIPSEGPDVVQGARLAQRRMSA